MLSGAQEVIRQLRGPSGGPLLDQLREARPDLPGLPDLPWSFMGHSVGADLMFPGTGLQADVRGRGCRGFSQSHGQPRDHAVGDGGLPAVPGDFLRSVCHGHLRVPNFVAFLNAR